MVLFYNIRKYIHTCKRQSIKQKKTDQKKTWKAKKASTQTKELLSNSNMDMSKRRQKKNNKRSYLQLTKL